MKLVLVLLCWWPISARATVGLAEWEVDTPGGNHISHIDPWIAEHGTCLRSGERIFVSHIDWWQLYRGKVVTHTPAGVYVFDERTKQVELLAAPAVERSLHALGKPLGRRMTPQDGYDGQWRSICASDAGKRPANLREICVQYEKARNTFREQARQACRALESAGTWSTADREICAQYEQEGATKAH
jgi:hypothetical protein